MSDIYKVSEPLSPLGRYRVLSPLAGVRASPLQLGELCHQTQALPNYKKIHLYPGAMSIGDKWEKFMGAMDRDSSFELLDAYYNAGGNFIDTANV